MQRWHLNNSNHKSIIPYSPFPILFCKHTLHNHIIDCDLWGLTFQHFCFGLNMWIKKKCALVCWMFHCVILLASKLITLRDRMYQTFEVITGSADFSDNWEETDAQWCMFLHSSKQIFSFCRSRFIPPHTPPALLPSPSDSPPPSHALSAVTNESFGALNNSSLFTTSLTALRLLPLKQPRSMLGSITPWFVLWSCFSYLIGYLMCFITRSVSLFFPLSAARW